MNFIKNDDKSITLIPHTASDQSFIDYLVELIKAKENNFLNEHALELESLVQDSQPLTIGSQS